MEYSRVLTIAGSDSSGGAGIQADIKAISANGCFATSVITAITAQNTIGVKSVLDVPVRMIEEQIDTVLSDIGTDYVKIGMLHTSKVVRAVAQKLQEYNIRNIVLDPVMVATSGDKLIKDEAIEVLKNELIPIARVITPNIPGAEILLGKRINKQDYMPEAAQQLGKKFSVSVFLKEGYMKEDKRIDVFYNIETNEIIKLVSKRIYTQNTHGTECTLSSALATQLAKGLSLTNAAQVGKDYLNNAIITGAKFKIGNSHSAVCHFYNKEWLEETL